MGTLTDTVVKLALAFCILLYFGPIVMIISITGPIDVTGHTISLGKLNRRQRIGLTFLGMLIWISIYGLLVLYVVLP